MLNAFVVTDPMCSWCWGMSKAIEEAAHQLADSVRFDLLLGGINVHGTQPIGEFGRRHLMKIWAEVEAVTGQKFGFTLPEDFIYNSTLPCVALEAVRRRSLAPPFGFLHRLQQALFESGENINDPLVVDAIATEFGWRPQEMLAELSDEALHGEVAEQFSTSRNFGTNALPAVLIEKDGSRQLLAGGYADSAMLIQLLNDQMKG